MTRRPRPHQIEDQSRHAFGRVLPSQWVVQRVEHDYGVDARVEIFDEAGHATGEMFFVQLKSTDRTPTRSGISVTLKRAHLGYWNSLPVPTMVVVWVAPTDTLYWRWAHLHHPWPRVKTPKVETFRLSPSDRWEPVDAVDVRAEVAFCQRARNGGLRPPLEVRFEDYRTQPLTPDDRWVTTDEWRKTVDQSIARVAPGVHPAQAVIHIGYRAVQVRLGRGIFSSALAPGHEHPDLTPPQIVDETAALLGLLLCNGGHQGIGLDLIAKHGGRCQFLAVTLSPNARGRRWPAWVAAISRSGRIDVGLDLVEAWTARRQEPFASAAQVLVVLLKAMGTRMSGADARRLERYLDAAPHLRSIVTPATRQSLAEIVAKGGFLADAIEQYETSFADADEEPDPETLMRFATLQEHAGQHREAASTFAALVHREPAHDEWRRRYGLAAAAGGFYGVAVPAFMSLTSQPLLGEAWARVMTMHMVIEVAGEPWQSRQPSGAEILARGANPDMARGERLDLFQRVAAQDALSVNTWRLYFTCAVESGDDLPFGTLGILPVAVLAWDDPEWWALILSLLMRDGLAEALLRSTECALRALGDEFTSMISRDGPLSSWVHPHLPEFVRCIAQLRADGHVLYVREEPIEMDGQPAVAIDGAPEGFRLFDTDLPPLDVWCPSAQSHDIRAD